jgi:hypothetical protein
MREDLGRSSRWLGVQGRRGLGGRGGGGGRQSVRFHTLRTHPLCTIKFICLSLVKLKFYIHNNFCPTL